MLSCSIGATAIYHSTPDGLKSPNHVSCFRGRPMAAASARRMRRPGHPDGCLRGGALGRVRRVLAGWCLRAFEAVGVVRNQWQSIGVEFVPRGCGAESMANDWGRFCTLWLWYGGLIWADMVFRTVPRGDGCCGKLDVPRFLIRLAARSAVRNHSKARPSAAYRCHYRWYGERYSLYSMGR